MQSDLKTVVVQGLGFVGAATVAAVSDAVDEAGNPLYRVIGVDLPNDEGRRRAASINAGRFPFDTSDPALESALAAAHSVGRIAGTTDPAAFGQADIVLVDVNLDLKSDGEKVDVSIDGFTSAIAMLAAHVSARTLIVVETTVPPGTCEKLVLPTLFNGMKRRGIVSSEDEVLLAHSYERVMPGADYLDSIVNYWRVYSATTDEAAQRCEAFLSSIINVEDYPLTRLESTTASEMAKVLENSYRATTIAFMDEWGRFAESLDIDLFQVIDAIRMRPTHSNIRQPGFGVGGYCLTKDPLFADIGARKFFGNETLSFPFCTQAVENNNRMPMATLDMVRRGLGGDLAGRKLLLCGVSYRQDVADTRYSPSEVFYRSATEAGAIVTCHDPLVTHWQELDLDLPAELPDAKEFDGVVFAVPHGFYKDLDLAQWINGSDGVVVDANRVLTPDQLDQLRAAKVACYSIGRGRVS
ncbi:MAG: nucleotide sugar dehydrogenase [Alphaproteobacteria bacterium]